MATHRINYRGPASLAVPTATNLADSDGVELTASEPPQRLGTDGQEVQLAVTVQGSAEAVRAAVTRIGADLPAGATVTIEEGG